MLPGLEFPNVRHMGIREIWYESGFNRYRGTGWMKEPCQSCPERKRTWAAAAAGLHAFPGPPTPPTRCAANLPITPGHRGGSRPRPASRCRNASRTPWSSGIEGIAAAVGSRVGRRGRFSPPGDAAWGRATVRERSGILPRAPQHLFRRLHSPVLRLLEKRKSRQVGVGELDPWRRPCGKRLAAGTPANPESADAWRDRGERRRAGDVAAQVRMHSFQLAQDAFGPSLAGVSSRRRRASLGVSSLKRGNR